MSAVMSTLSIISGGRRTHRKLTSRKSSGQFSDADAGAGEDRTRSHHDLSKQQRSASLQTLEAGGGGGGAGVVNLESLEAKMANIEVSLVGSRRRSAGARDVTRELDALRTALSDKDSMIQSLKKQLSASLSAARLAAAAASPCAGGGGGGGGAGADEREDCAALLSADERRALEDRAHAVKADLDARRNNIHELRKRLEKTHVTDNIDTRIQQAELQYKLGREELELLTLGEQARALAQLIEQADARARALATQEHTLYSMVRECGGSGVVVASEVRDGSWRCAPAPRGPGLVIDWTAEHSLVRPGDRLVEVNGTVVVSCRSQEEAQRAAREAVPARLVVLRARHVAPPSTTFTQDEAVSLRTELGALRAAADDAERAKETLRSDNTRLTHRISYLEEQVAELLDRHGHLRPTSSVDSCITVNKSRKNVTHINIGAEPAAGGRTSRSEVQVFQKGPDITAIVAKLPGLDGSDANLPLMRPRSNASGASSRASPPPPAHHTPRAHSSHGAGGGEHRASRMRPALSHHCIHAADYGAETDAAIRMIERNQRHMEKQRLRDRLARSHDYLDLLPSASPSPSPVPAPAPAHDSKHYEIEKAADRIEESIKKTNWAERKTLSIIEQLKRSQRLRKLRRSEGAGAGAGDDESTSVEPTGKAELARRIDGKVLENAHKSSRRSSKLHSRSARSSEFESECSDFPGGEGGGSRPTPPRKPLRLSLHRARSAHDLQPPAAGAREERPGSEAGGGGGKRPVKRSHATGAGAGGRDRSHATPRPPRKLLDGLTAPPAPDRLYPEPPPHHLALKAAGNWC